MEIKLDHRFELEKIYAVIREADQASTRHSCARSDGDINCKLSMRFVSHAGLTALKL